MIWRQAKATSYRHDERAPAPSAKWQYINHPKLDDAIRGVVLSVCVLAFFPITHRTCQATDRRALCH